MDNPCHIRGPIGKQHDMLKSYLEELKRVSKNGTFMREVNLATKKGFDELKMQFLARYGRVISLDGCFLKDWIERYVVMCH